MEFVQELAREHSKLSHVDLKLEARVSKLTSNVLLLTNDQQNTARLERLNYLDERVGTSLHADLGSAAKSYRKPPAFHQTSKVSRRMN